MSEIIDTLPIDVLTGTQQDIIEALTQTYGCPRDYVVASMFAAVSTVLGKNVRCRFGAYHNYPNLWIALVGNSSVGKTQPMQWFFRPIDEDEDRWLKNYEDDVAVWKRTPESQRGSKPYWKHRLISDATDESVMEELMRQGALCWHVDELDGLFAGIGQYSKSGKSPMETRMLSIYSCQSINISRKTLEPVRVVNPVLSIAGGIQPEILKSTFGSKKLHDGMLSRFLFAFPPATPYPLPRDVDTTRLDSLAGSWQLEVDTLARLAPGTEFHETPEAASLRRDIITNWTVEVNENFLDDSVTASMFKKREYEICRLAIVVAALLKTDLITPDIIRYCGECMEYFIWCGRRVIDTIRGGDYAQSNKMTKGEILAALLEAYPETNQSQLAQAIGVSQPNIAKAVKKFAEKR